MVHRLQEHIVNASFVRHELLSDFTEFTPFARRSSILRISVPGPNYFTQLSGFARTPPTRTHGSSRSGSGC